MKKYFTRTAVAALAAIAMTASFLSVSAATKTETKAAETAKESTKKDDAAAKLAEETKVADADAKTIKIKKSPPPVKRVVRLAGYKPLLLGQRLKALAFALRSGQTALDSSPPLKGHSYYWP